MSAAFKKVFSHPRPLAFILSRLLLRLRIPLPFTVWYSRKYNVRIRLTPMPIAHKAFLRDDDQLTEQIFSRFIQETSTVFDVGANIGTHALLAAKIASRGRVFAFEPGQKAFQNLRENSKLNTASNLVPIFGAVYTKSGTMELFEHVRSNEKNFLLTHDIVEPSSEDKNSRVPVYRLDDVMQERSVQEVNFLKIDVEGAELDVLHSLGERISDVITIYFEYSGKNYTRYGHTFTDIVALLQNAQFSLYAPSVQEGALLLMSLSKDESKAPKNIVATRQVV